VAITDGDTFVGVLRVETHATADVPGWRVTTTTVAEKEPAYKVRLLGINCPEKRDPGGKEATAYTVAWLQNHAHADVYGSMGAPLRFDGDAEDNFGRLLAVVSCAFDGAVLNTDLLNAGHAAVYRALAHVDALLALDRAGHYAAGALLNEMGEP
jgi:endonuclease YncB( thermonuclease family)